MKNFASILATSAIILGAPSVTEARHAVACTMQYAPVCGTDMDGTFRTYGNSCTLGAQHGRFQHDGECTAAELSGKGSVGAYAPPPYCTAWFDGCNSCGTSPDGATYCTLKACIGDLAPGYCTAYGDEDEVPEHVSAPLEDSETGPTAMPEATTSTAVKKGFLERIWMSISLWFAGWF